MKNSFTFWLKPLYGNDGERSTAKGLFILYIDRRKTYRGRNQFHYTGFMDVRKGNISKGWMTKQVFMPVNNIILTAEPNSKYICIFIALNSISKSAYTFTWSTIWVLAQGGKL